MYLKLPLPFTLMSCDNSLALSLTPNGDIANIFHIIQGIGLESRLTIAPD